MRTPRTVFALVLAAILAAQVALAEPPQRDGGQPGDAGNTKATARLLADYGVYGGELRSHDDDWYTLLHPVPAVRCVSATVSGDTQGTTTLALASGGTERSIQGAIPTDGSPIRITLAASGVTQAWSGMERNPNPVGNDQARPRHYAFDLRSSSPMGRGDAGTSSDAGSVLTGALSATGSCTEGDLNPLSGLGDVRDVFTFSVAKDTQVIYSLGATAPLSLRMYSPSGALLGEIATDGVGTFVAPATGTYSMEAMALGESGLAEYVIGLVGPPPGGSCRPHCMVG